jgi:3-phosphoshikimate 1-carboxyvinyltransferase
MRTRVDAHFAPAGAPAGRLVAPPDKSISHRAALLGAFGEGTTRIGGYLDSADTRSSLAAMEALGAVVDAAPGDRDGALDVTIEGFGLTGAAEPADPIDAGNAGTLIRLLAGLLAGQEGRSFRLDGDASLRSRPMARIAEPLIAMGGSVATSAGRPPLEIAGRRLRAIHHEMTIASAQVKSCLLLAGLLASGRTTVREPAASRDHTERMLRAAGADVRVERERPSLPGDPVAATIGIVPAERIALPPLRVPGDLSSAAFHLAAALLVPGADVTVAGVGLNPTRVGLLGILNRMGADLEVVEEGHEGGEPVGSIRVRHGELAAALVGGAEVPAAIDELPLVGLLGCFAEGTTQIRDATELRHKESDRIVAVVAAINAIGGEAEANDDGFAVTGTGGLRGGEIDAGGDHRLAMLGAVAGLASREGVTVRGFGCARVSYPGFERDLRSLLPG